MATASSDNGAPYENTQTPPLIVERTNNSIKQEIPDDSFPDIPHCWNKSVKHENCTWCLTDSCSNDADERLEKTLLLERSFSTNHSDTCSSSIHDTKGQCSMLFDGTEVKQGVRDIPSTPPAAAEATHDQDDEEEEYKIKIDDHVLLTYDLDEDKGSKNGIERFSLAHTKQTNPPCPTGGRDNCDKQLFQTARANNVLDVGTENHVIREAVEHANRESPISKPRETLCTQRTEKGLKSPYEITTSSNAKAYKCLQCEFTTKYKRNVSAHILTEHDPSTNIHKCGECGFASKYKASLRRHAKTSHTSDVQLYECFRCDVTTTIKRQLIKHIRLTHEHDVAALKCPHCKYTARYKSDLARHTNAKHDINPVMHKCSDCAFQTKYKHVLKSHVKRTHEPKARTYKCSACGHTDEYEIDLSGHIIEKHNARSDVYVLYKCPRCKFATKHETVLTEHTNVKHNSTCGVYRCSECAFTTSSEKFFCWHFKAKHEYSSTVIKRLSVQAKARCNPHPELHRCARCTFVTKWKRNLIRHKKTMHGTRHQTPCDTETAQVQCFLVHTV